MCKIWSKLATSTDLTMKKSVVKRPGSNVDYNLARNLTREVAEYVKKNKTKPPS